MKTVIFWGLPEDAPLAIVRAELRARRVPALFLDQRRIGEIHADIRFTPRLTGEVRVGARCVRIEDVAGIYLRPYDLRDLPELDGFDERTASWRHAAAVEDILRSWAETAPALVLNRPSAMASNGSKPYQAHLIREAGFATPPTLITTDPAAAQAFWRRHGAVVYKSISGTRSIVTRLTGAHRERLREVVWCPTQFQALVPGDEYRVHVVGNAVFACRVISAAVDYRYGEARIEPAELPREVAGRCVRLASRLALPLAGFDLRRTRGGEWYCFEVNPSPAFPVYEPAGEHPIGAAIAALLVEACRQRSRRLLKTKGRETGPT